MEMSQIQPYSWDVLNSYVNWTQTPECHIYSADIPGARMEEIKVEVEDSKFLIIRTEFEASSERRRSFMRKFRLPRGVDVEGISAGYENGVLTVTVPRCHVRRGFYIEPSDMPDTSTLVHTAKAA